MTPREIALLHERLEQLTERAQEAEAGLAQSNEHTNKLEMQLEAVRNERDEARQGLKDWLVTHPPSICSRHLVLDLTCSICNGALHERDAAQASCAELKNVLTAFAGSEIAIANKARIEHALSADAGKEWIGPDEHKARMDALQKRLIAVCSQYT